ncbi:hypothetical protein GJ744_012394 [Endocarpon pusillum]|uniref:Azaphilone pigments biosynthesis cluster protein L N-terminal domain-containing protein n=1 Tax=Endocarpon pusillum TaxID=364733 RepID=A0A8H7ADU6_9EURO|nr:hypothetical protein GJ744_012394 [Endocarpon pusillum]
MAEAVGAASGVLALTVFAFKASKSLFEAVSSFRSQRRTIQDIETDLGALVAVLNLIIQQAQGSGNDSKLEPLREPVKCCTKTCQEMQEMLDACTRHAKDNRDSIRDWLHMRYHEKNLQDNKQRLASYKSTLNIIFASMNIQDHATTQDYLNELKRSIEGTKEDLEDQLGLVEQAISGAEASRRGLLLADQVQVVIERNRGGEDSRTLFGTDTSRPAFSLTVSDNEAQRGAVMAAGVHSPEVLQSLLKGTPAADLVLVLQTLRNQSPSNNTDMLPSFLDSHSAGRTLAIDMPSTMNATPRPPPSRPGNEQREREISRPVG